MKQIIILFVFFSSYVNGQIKVGDKMPTLNLLNTTNEKISETSIKNKFVLIDFWASWCAPCRLGNKKLVKLHTELNQKTIEIIGISIDTDKNKWIKAIEKDKIKFTQIIDPKGFDAKTAVLFGVEELPSKFLFNKNGILIKINPTEEEIFKLINQ